MESIRIRIQIQDHKGSSTDTAYVNVCKHHGGNIDKYDLEIVWPDIYIRKGIPYNADASVMMLAFTDQINAALIWGRDYLKQGVPDLPQLSNWKVVIE